MSTDVGFVRFACMSYASTDEPVRESDTCLAFQRTQLAARVKELEPYEAICKNPAALWASWLRGTVVLPAGIGDVRQEQARVKELEAKSELNATRELELEAAIACGKGWKAERDQLLSTLETQRRGVANAERVLCAVLGVADGSQVLDAIAEIKAKLEAWEAYAGRLEVAGDTLATVTLRNGRSHDQRHEAKETKP